MTDTSCGHAYLIVLSDQMWETSVKPAVAVHWGGLMLNTRSWLTLAVADVVGVDTAYPMLHNDSHRSCCATKSALSPITKRTLEQTYLQETFSPNTSSI